MTLETMKLEAKKLVNRLPEGSSWEDLMHEIYVHQAIESGFADSQAGRTKDVSEVRKQFGLTP